VLWRKVELECYASDLCNMLCINRRDGLRSATLCSKPEGEKTPRIMKTTLAQVTYVYIARVCNPVFMLSTSAIS
jgi:hypothetical protein